MFPTRYASSLKTGFLALTLGATLALSAPGSAIAGPGGATNHSKSFHMQVSSGGQLGAQVLGISDELRQFFGAAKGEGILVDRVLPNSPAAKAGLKSGDLITQVDSQTIAGHMDIFEVLSSKKKGDTVGVTVLRNKKAKTLRATLDGTSPLSMQWGSIHEGKSPLDSLNPFGGSLPKGFEKAFGPGKMKIEFGDDFPFEHAPLKMQEKMRQMEERLNRLEGKKQKTKKKKSKSAPAGPQS